MVRLERAVILGTVVLAALSWLLSAIRDWLLHYDGTFWQLLITDVPRYEWYTRLFVVSVVMATGGIVLWAVMRRKVVEEALREDKERYRMLTENMRDVIISTDGDLLPIYVSPSMEMLTGFTAEEALKRTAAEALTPESLQAAAKAFAKAIDMQGTNVTDSSKPGVTELEFYRKDGGTVFVEATTDLLRRSDDQVVGTISVLRDITERKQQERYFRALIENSSDVIIVANRDGTIRYISPSLAHMLGRDPQERAGKSSFDFIHPDDLESVRDAFSRILESGGSSGHMEVQILHDNGSWRYLDIIAVNLLDDPVVAGIVVNLRDVTDRRLAEAALRESEARYRLLAENTADVIVSTDVNGKPTYVSPSVTRLLGRTVEEAMNGTLDGSVVSTSKKTAREAQAKQFTTDQPQPVQGTEPFTIELELLRKDGSTVWVEATVSFIQNTQGEPDGVVTVLRDIDARKKAQEEVQRMERQLLLSGRLAAVGELAAGVAHELNNPLAAVQAYSQFLSGRQDLDESMREDVDTIYKEAQRAAKITSNLLQFSRKHEPEKKLISINQVIEEGIELNAYRLKVNNIDVSTNLDSELPKTMADFFQLQQVFVNLITNAEHAMAMAHGRGTLTITSGVTKGAIKVTFADDGPGIPQENLDRIFDPFFTTKDVGEGTGLGLSICFGIVQQHGGTIYANSRVGEGTTFMVELPITADEAVREQADPIQIDHG